ncbi:MAG: hypothetical protein AB7E13_06990 [Arcobacteraceae bacterium]
MATKKYDTILIRLIGIITKIACNELPTTSQLASEYNVTTRTIQKDIYQRLSSFPIHKNEHNQFYFPKGYKLSCMLEKNSND